MTFHIQMQDFALDGVSHRWTPASGTCRAYGTIEFGAPGRDVIVFLTEAAQIDEVIAELAALRAKMAPPAPGCACVADAPGDGGVLFPADDDEDGPMDDEAELRRADEIRAAEVLDESITAGTPVLVVDDEPYTAPCLNPEAHAYVPDGKRVHCDRPEHHAPATVTA